MVRVGTVCSGVEAPIVALDQLGLPYRHVFSCEKDEACRTVIAQKFSPEVTYGDVCAVTDAPEVDVLVAGLPCQSFSQIGKGKGLKDKRGNLYLEFCRVLDASRPEWFVVENVRNFLGHDEGRTFECVVEAFTSRGYSVDHRRLTSSDYGVPQSRERVYIVGRRARPVNYEWPPKFEGLRYTLDDVLGGKCERDMGYTVRVGGRRSGYGDRHNWDEYLVDGEVVALRPFHCCLLQGFPGDFYDGVDGVSESAKFAQMGNAMTVDVVGAVMGSLKFFGVEWRNLFV